MNVSFEPIAQTAIGCFDGEVVNGAWHPQRIPGPLRPFYGREEASRIRMACTSGVRLRFRSDTTQVRLGLRYGVEARTIYRGAMLVDRQPAVAFGPEQRQEEWTGTIFEAPDRARRVFDIWLPHLCQADVLSLEVDDGSLFEPARPLPQRWLAYGDSITQGMTATLPVWSYVGRCALALEAEVRNVGIGGAVLNLRLAENIPDGRYDLISIAYGTNDFNRGIPPEEYRDNARRLVAALRAGHPHTPIVVITTLTWAGLSNPNKGGSTLEEYRQILDSLPREFPKVSLVPGNAMLTDEERWFVDKIHPNDAGFEEYAKNLLPYLRRRIEIDSAHCQG